MTISRACHTVSDIFIRAGIYCFIIFIIMFLCGCSHTGTPEEIIAPDEESDRIHDSVIVPVATPVPEIQYDIRINEFMPSNKSTLADSNGVFSDWFEIINYGNSEISLDGVCVTCNTNTYEFDNITLAPGEIRLFFADGFISRDGGVIAVYSPQHNLIDSVAYETCESDISIIYVDTETYSQTALCTPGFENTESGFEAFQSSLTCSSIVISEVMVYNDSYLPQSGIYYDWVEITNVSGESINLSGFSLSDSLSDPGAYVFPDIELAPGSCYVVFCTGEESVKKDNQAVFALNAEYDRLYLYDSGSLLCDYACLRNIPLNCSYGRSSSRNGWVYYDRPTPGAENSSAEYRFISENPVSGTEPGVYDDVECISVALYASGDIYYTLDGSVPTSNSTLYTEPVVLYETSVIRAISVEADKLVDSPLTLTYIINEGHTLPVVSLVADPTEMNSMYRHPENDTEITANVSLFEGDDSFSIDCGAKLHGQTSKNSQAKKSFKLCFRSRYDGNLQYDVFDNGITDLSSILLRAAAESDYSSYMRDNIMHQLALEAFPDLPAQDYKYAVLYVNGQYRGIYNIREAHSATFYASHFGYDADDVGMCNGNTYLYSEDYVKDIVNVYNTLMSFRDMNSEEANEYINQHLNTGSIIGWSIIEAYSANFDIYPTNIRFYWSASDERLSFALSDLDLGMFRYEGFVQPLALGYWYNSFAMKLLENDEYSQAFIEALSDSLHTTLSNENVLSLIDSLADEIRPEVAREKQYWGGSVEQWERMITALKAWVCDYIPDRVTLLAKEVRQYVSMTPEDYDKYFGDLY